MHTKAEVLNANIRQSRATPGELNQIMIPISTVGTKLRFLMSAYADLSTEARESARPETRAMRAQLAAWQAVLRQSPGRPLALEHAVVLLFAVSQG